MAFCARHGKLAALRRSCLGVCAVGLTVGCGSIDRGLLEDLLDREGRGHGGGHHGGHGGNGGGEPGATPCSSQFTADDLYSLIARDVAGLDADAQPFARYLTLSNQANAIGCGAALDVSRAALTKLVNSVSNSPTVEPPVPVDAEETLYRVDIREYEWDRPIEVDGTVFPDAWEAIVASSVYAVPFVGDDAADAVADTGTAVPVIFGDAFVDAVARAPLYYGLLGIPEDIDDFLIVDLGVDVRQALRDNEVTRAGFEGTDTSAAEFLAERFELETRAGFVWQIHSGAGGAEEILSDPLGIPEAEERELVFTLPNGLLGHALADGDGRRLDESALTLDTNQNNFVASVAASYFRLRALGVSPRDDVRQFVADNEDQFDRDTIEIVPEIYVSAEDLAAIVESDREAFFEAAHRRLNLDIFDTPEPISEVFLQFDRDVDLETAAGDLLISAEDLEDNLSLLDPALSVLDGGRLDRQDWTFFYRDSLCILSVTSENRPSPDICQ
jgi:hypothetical protein